MDGSDREQFSPHRIKLQFTIQDVNIPLIRIPVRLARAGAVHKTQGKTLPIVLVYLGSNDFSPGHLYVALSRV